MQQPETNPSLIVRLKSTRNELAWTEFVSVYEPFLRCLIQRRGVADRHLPDVTQQVLIAIARSVDGWRDDGDPASFRRWLSRVARNVVLKFMSRVGDILKQEAQASRADATGGWTADFQAPWHDSGDSQLPPRAGHLLADADFVVDFLEPSTTPQTLGQLGDIEIHEVIGHGGMGIVLRGFQRELNRPVAVKVLAPHLAMSGAARKRFAREAQATAVVVHPNVMPILTVHSSGKLPHLVMPYVACESLQQRLDRDGPLATVDVLRIAMQVASGLAAAHAQGLVHRDIKPANVLLEKGVDRALLTDFGLARAVDDATLTRTGVIAGTPQFMSPEQARGESVDPRSDLFSLGSTMYAMCTGRPPFRAETSYGILRRIIDTEPRAIREINPEVPDWLAAMIGKLHGKDPAERFQSAEELAKQLEACLAHVQRLEVKASRFWDNQLSSAESNNSANSIQPLGQESTK